MCFRLSILVLKKKLPGFLGAAWSPALSVTLPLLICFLLFLSQLHVKEFSTSQLMDPQGKPSGGFFLRGSSEGIPTAVD